MASLDGFRGIQVLRRPHDNAVDFVVITLWESMEAIRAFTGPNTDVAVIASDAQALLSRYDRQATHYEVAMTA